MPLELVATCALGLEALVAAELTDLGLGAEPVRGAVRFRGGWSDVVRTNLRVRTANRILLRLGSWPAPDGDALARGAAAVVRDTRKRLDGVPVADLFDPANSLAIRASSSRSAVTDVRWIALRAKDGIVDAQRARFGRRSSIDRNHPVLPLRHYLDRDRASLLLDTSGAPLDRRGYRVTSTRAPVREQLAAACVLAADWDGSGPVVDPMCGSATLLIEAGWIALGRPPGYLRRSWAFQRLPGVDPAILQAVRKENSPGCRTGARPAGVELIGIDRDAAAVSSALENLTAAELDEHARVRRGDAFDFDPPEGPGLVITNPAYGHRLDAPDAAMKRLGDLLKQRYTGWRAVVLAGDPARGKHIGLRPSRRISVKHGPLDARILVFDLH